jgi:hypothetical protein
MSKYHNDGCHDSHAGVCCRTVKYIFGVSGVDLFLCNGVIYNAEYDGVSSAWG